MNPYDQQKIDAIERDRRKREDELLLALLLLWDDAKDDIETILRHGYSVAPVIASTQSQVAYAISTSMANAHRDGVKRAARLAGETVPQSGAALRNWTDTNAGTIAELRDLYQAAARDAALAQGQAVSESLDKYIPSARQLTASELKRSVRDAFDEAGYTKFKPFALDVGTARAIVGAHNAGMFAAGTALRVITGLRHVSVIDDRTTLRCRERDGLVLPIDDEYWTQNIPPLHWNCRSAVLPVTGEFEPSDWRPTIPAAPGFGEMSAVFIQRLKGGLAA